PGRRRNKSPNAPPYSCLIVVSSSALPYASTQFIIEALGLQKFLQRQVHPVAPLVVGIGRDVDAFFVWILSAQMLIHAQQVLELEDAPDGRRGQMLRDDGFIDP